ncbi:MAG TPA: dockerin type I repeat-containing protein [Armatimonadota bacterium]|jgi:hypothetical protein
MWTRVLPAASCLIACVAARATDVSGDVFGRWTVFQNPIRVTADCRVPAGKTLEIGPGVSVQIAGDASITVDGDLLVWGINSRRTTFDKVAADAAPWRCVAVNSGGHASFTNASLRGGGAATALESTGMLRLDGGLASLNGCDVSGSASSGVFVNGGSLSASSTSFSGNGGAQPTDAAIHVVYGPVILSTGTACNSICNGVWGIYNEDIVPVLAAGTWWGAANGPQNPENILGGGSSVSDDVTFDGFVTTAPHPGRGDVNADGAVDVKDALLALRAVGGMQSATADILRADYNGDGAVDILDVVSLIQQALR